MPDHVHILVGLKPDISISDLVRDIKAGSSKFISNQNWVRGKFSWQAGFGAFSYFKSHIESCSQILVIYTYKSSRGAIYLDMLILYNTILRQND